MTEKYESEGNLSDINKELNNSKIENLLKTPDLFYNEAQTDPETMYMTFDEVKAIRKSLAILLPETKFESDELLYKDIVNETRAHQLRQEIGEQVDNCVCRKIIFPEKSEELNEELGKSFLYEIIYDELMSSSADKDIYNTYMQAQDLKILFPQKFEELDLLEIFRTNSWQDNIKKEFQNKKLYETHEEYCEIATDLAASLNMINYPNKVLLHSQELAEFKKYAHNLYLEEYNQTEFIEYMAKLKIISAKRINISDTDFRLIF